MVRDLGILAEFGVTQAQTHTFPSEISRLSRLRKMSLYLFLLSGAGGNPWRGEYHTWVNRSLSPPTTPWQVVWRVRMVSGEEVGGNGVGWGRGMEGKRKEREREFWSHGECRMGRVFELGWRECGLGWDLTQDRQMDSGTTQHRDHCLEKQRHPHMHGPRSKVTKQMS